MADRARGILRGEQRLMLREEAAAPALAARARANVPAAAAAEGGPAFEALRAWRAAEAKTQHVPPYVIFHDSVLRDIAAIRPASLDELGQVKGVGASKLLRYGRAVLAAVRGKPATASG